MQVVLTLIQLQMSAELVRVQQAQLDFINGGSIGLADLFPISTLIVGIIGGAVVAAAGFIGEGALIDLTRRIQEGEAPSARRALGSALRRVVSLAGAGLLVVLVTTGMAVAGIAAGLTLIFANQINGNAQAGPIAFAGICLVVAAVVAEIFVSIRLSFVVQALMFESRSATGSIGRSWRLVAGSGWRVLGYSITFGLLIGVVGLIVSAIIDFGLGTGFGIVNDTVTFDPTIFLANSLAYSFVSVALTPIPIIAMTLLFLDIRFRREGAPTEHAAPASVSEQQV
jgi:hypothetical protein